MMIDTNILILSEDISITWFWLIGKADITYELEEIGKDPQHLIGRR
jgi:hypothetical protein